MKAIWEWFVVRCLRKREPNLKLHSRLRIWPIGTRYKDSARRVWRYVKWG